MKRGDSISLQEHFFHVQHSCDNLLTSEAFSWMKEEAPRSVSGAFTQHTFGASWRVRLFSRGLSLKVGVKFLF